MPWPSLAALLASILVTGLLGAPDTVWGEFAEGFCMQEQAGFSLNCTANDVEIAGVARDPDTGEPLLEITDPCDYPGDETTFTATFDIVLNAKDRTDVGIYFVRDGDPNGDGAVSGLCTIGVLPIEPSPPYLDLDGDACGDISKPDYSPLEAEVTITAVCKDDDGDGFLNLPNCTSWRNTDYVCYGPTDAFPTTPSKCKCDIGFNVPVPVPPAELKVSKTASPTAVDEPGEAVTYQLSVTNIGIDPNNPVTLSSLMDDLYGDVTQVQGAITATTCALPQTIPSDDGHVGGIDTYTCQFTADALGNGGDTITDTVTGAGIDARGNPISGEDDASVSIIDVLPAISVDKTAAPTEVLEPGDTVGFTVVIGNTSTASSDPLTITSLVDTIHGDLNGQGDCTVPQTLPWGASYSCSFSAFVAGNAGYSETDVVTATGADDEGNAVSGSDSATVDVEDVPSSIELMKTASPTALDEPGGEVSFTLTIYNLSTVDTVTIDGLVDSVHGDLGGTCGLPWSILPGGSQSCTFTTFVQGNAYESETNVATASGVDDDGVGVEDTDDATVNFTNVAPAASLTKTAKMALVTYELTVTNLSDAEALTLTGLVDDQFGDVADPSNPAIESTWCVAPQELEANDGFPGGGDTYTCTFEAWVSTSPHTDTVTATVEDDDGSLPAEPNDSATVTLD
jgi:hypothetical protein